MSVVAKVLKDAAYITNSLSDMYTCPASTRTILDKVTVTNTDSGSLNVDIYVIPAGQSSGDNNRIIHTLAVASHATTDITQLQNHILAAGDKIQAVASSTNKVNIRISGRECT